MKLKIALLLFSFLEISSVPKKDKFIGDVIVKWLSDGREMKLLDDFTYIDPNGKYWTAPKNSIIDGASIPQVFWTIIGGPFEGNYRNASVVHDYYCDRQLDTWKNVHRMFYNACLTGGVEDAKAKIMYAAVYVGGPRWEKGWVKKGAGNHIVQEVTLITTNASQDKFKDIAEWIKETNPKLEAITDTLNTIVVETDRLVLP